MTDPHAPFPKPVQKEALTDGRVAVGRERRV
jgi:hypothetical protein